MQCGRSRFDPWVKKIPWRRKWQPTPVFLPGKFHGRRNLVGYSLWVSKSQTGLSNFTHSLPHRKQTLYQLSYKGIYIVLYWDVIHISHSSFRAYHSVDSQSCAAIETINFRTFSSSQKEISYSLAITSYFSQSSSFPPLGNNWPFCL